nr:hypothetical protein [Propionicimonas sp.]
MASTGQTHKDRARLSRAGELVRVRHGAYAEVHADGVIGRHRQLIAGTAPILGPDTVLSHSSASVLHGLPVWEPMLGRVTVIRRSHAHGSRGRHLHARRAPLAPEEIVFLEGISVTNLERTAIDMACLLPFARAVAVLDAALHMEADKDVMAAVLTAAHSRRGVGTARRAFAFADGRAESVGESVSRVVMASQGVPAPLLQVNVYDEFGNWLARTDFGWAARGVLGEFDGKVKYTGTPEEVAAAVMKEKRREDRLRQLGWVVVRWGWADPADPAGLRRRLEAAFAQARPDLIRGRVELA